MQSRDFNSSHKHAGSYPPESEILNSTAGFLSAVFYRLEWCEDDIIVRYLSPSFRPFCGLRPNRFIGYPLAKLLYYLCPHEKESILLHYQEAVQKMDNYRLSYLIERPGGQKYTVVDEGSVVNRENGKVFIDGVFRDVTQEIEMKDKISHLNDYDALTHLPSRSVFMDRLDQLLIRLPRGDEFLAVMCLDLDHFKRINNTFGFHCGDQLICKVAKRLQNIVYETDTIMRMGGDSFMLLFPHLRKPQHAEVVVKKILDVFAEPFSFDGTEVFVKCSLGVSLAPTDAKDANTLLQNADACMRHAKKKKNKRFHYYSENLQQDFQRNMLLENELWRALDKNQFELHYQPLLDVTRSKIAGVEALLRWRHPVMGYISPMDFIPIAEETGLIHEIGAWVLETACLQKKAWEDTGVYFPKMAVNISAHQFYHLDLCGLVKDILGKTGLDAASLELEITEGTAMKMNRDVIGLLNNLRNLGVTISIDDFGTGYSSLAVLKHLPIDTLKIDRSFICEMTHNSEDQAIVEAIITMAHKLKLNVVAEGVETSEQYECLKRARCNRVQGFLFSKPLPHFHFESFFFDNNQDDQKKAA